MNSSPGVDTCEQPVWIGLEWISINANAGPIRINFFRIGEQERKSIQILVNVIPIR